jgi:hypothetical protein
MPTTLVIFTSKKLENVVELGGTGWWKVDPVKARSATHVVLTHNAFDKRRPGDPGRHGDAYLVATIRDVLQDDDGRWLLQFDEYAKTDAGLKWPGYRNPVNYADTEKTLSQLEVSEWQTMPTVTFEDAQSVRRRDDASTSRMQARQRGDAKSTAKGRLSFGEIIELHREQLAADLGVDPASVRISIEASK